MAKGFRVYVDEHQAFRRKRVYKPDQFDVESVKWNTKERIE